MVVQVFDMFYKSTLGTLPYLSYKIYHFIEQIMQSAQYQIVYVYRIKHY